MIKHTPGNMDCPQTGDMGIYLLNYITMLKYNLRGVTQKVQEFLSANNDLDLSINEISDALLRVGDACRSESGSQNYQYISSLLATWRLKGKSMFVEIDKILRKELCGFG